MAGGGFQGDHGSMLRRLCLPEPPRKPPVPRPVQVALRTLHIVAMGMLIGALP